MLISVELLEKIGKFVKALISLKREAEIFLFIFKMMCNLHRWSNGGTLGKAIGGIANRDLYLLPCMNSSLGYFGKLR